MVANKKQTSEPIVPRGPTPPGCPCSPYEKKKKNHMLLILYFSCPLPLPAWRVFFAFNDQR